jgi:FkbM family methyltransferase
MKVSVITPSFNQGQFLPFNIESVSGQTHDHVEHIIVDPGSSDGSRDIAAAARHAILIAEPDRGQSDGICKGFARSTGDILTWLNSDDLYPDEGVLAQVADEFEKNPDVDVIYGKVNFVDEDGKFLRKGYVNPNESSLLETFQYQVGIVQPGLFMRRRVFEALGGPSDQYEYCMDYEYWVRIASAGYKWKYLDHELAHHRWWGGMKTSKGRDASSIEHMRVCSDYFGYIHWKWLDRYAEYLTSKLDGIVHHSTTTDPAARADNLAAVIERFVNQDMIRRLETSQDPQQAETLQFILRNAPALGRYFAPADEIVSLTESHPDPDAEKRTAWHIFEGEGGDGRRYRTYNVPSNFHRAFDAAWYEETRQSGVAKLVEMARRKTSDVCVIVANGPSLNKADFSLLTDVDVIISNFAILNETLLGLASMVTVTNTLVAEQGAVSFNKIRTPKVFPIWLSHVLNHTDETSFVPATVNPAFCTSFHDDFSWRSTVSYFNMQLAYTLGYEKVVLIGFDHSYQQPAYVKEGDLIEQNSDDLNHFDPRYFKNKVWQAADTGNMETAYKVAKAAYEAAGRDIVNCTEGGQLEVFRRGDLAQELSAYRLGGRPAPVRRPAPPPAKAASLPRVLVFDLTCIGDGTATGEVKRAIFGSWPAERYMQVYNAGGNALGVKTGEDEPELMPGADPDALQAKVRSFRPDLILYRPVPDAPLLHQAAMQTILGHEDIPLATWIMDDWPARLEAASPKRFAAFDADWRALLARSSLRLSISRKMSETMQARYGFAFIPFANGVDPREWPAGPARSEGPFTLRYAGALADDMTARSVLRVAQAVERLAEAGRPVRMEIQTKPYWRDQQAAHYSDLRNTQFHTDLLSADEYRAWLSGADAVLIAYNFDEESLRYIGASLANKLPECLASGAPLIAHGPREAATIAYLQHLDCARLVTAPDADAVADAIAGLMDSPEDAKALAARARSAAFTHHNIHRIRARFGLAMIEAARSGLSTGAPAQDRPERARSAHAYVDETAIVAHMLADRQGNGHVLVDVGAHHGYSAEYFRALGWTIHCFEPDPENRAKLEQRFIDAPDVRIDPRAVSDAPATGLQFFTSQESTGISGLLAFRDSHVATTTVDATTVAEIITDRSLETIDFLKIDVEGYDLNVLRGVPWDALRPDVIECEFEDAKTLKLGHTSQDVADFLESKGYTVYVSEWHPIIRYGIAHDWKRVVPYRGCTLAPDAWGNFLAFREDPGFDAVAEAFDLLVKERARPPVAPPQAQAARPPAPPVQPVQPMQAGPAEAAAAPSATEPASRPVSRLVRAIRRAAGLAFVWIPVLAFLAALGIVAYGPGPEAARPVAGRRGAGHRGDPRALGAGLAASSGGQNPVGLRFARFQTISPTSMSSPRGAKGAWSAWSRTRRALISGWGDLAAPRRRPCRRWKAGSTHSSATSRPLRSISTRR